MTEEQSFWTTVPGILTGIGGVIGAGAALVTALYSAGIIGNRATNNATPGVQTEEKEGDPEKKNNQDMRGKISGKWSIRYGILYYKVESSNVPFIEQGSTYEGKITSITDDQLTQINLADGQTTVSFRVK